MAHYLSTGPEILQQVFLYASEGEEGKEGGRERRGGEEEEEREKEKGKGEGEGEGKRECEREHSAADLVYAYVCFRVYA